MAPPRARSGASVLPLPLDAIYEVLLRVPARDLCRLRAVCRPWRALLSDPQFIAAHAASHPEPLIVAGHYTNLSAAGNLLDIMDLSGRVVKQVFKPGGWELKEWVMTAQLDVVGVLLGASTGILFNPATGAVFTLPQGFAEEHQAQLVWGNYMPMVTVGKVASTGEYKVLRVLRSYYNLKQPCEVCTLNGSSHAQWRGKKASPYRVDFHRRSRVTIDGIVYFLSSERVINREGVVPTCIPSFDLETEEWRAVLQAPVNLLIVPDSDLSMASLNGCLVVIHYIKCSSMDLWFMIDFEKGLWAKQHSIPLKLGICYDEIPVRPLLVLNGGRILYYEDMGLLRIYDPKTCTSTDVAEIGPRCELGLYTGNLLSLSGGVGAQLMR